MNLLFDLDGTLTNPVVGITASIRYALAQLGRSAPPPGDLRWCIGLRKAGALSLGYGHDRRPG